MWFLWWCPLPSEMVGIRTREHYSCVQGSNIQNPLPITYRFHLHLEYEWYNSASVLLCDEYTFLRIFLWFRCLLLVILYEIFQDSFGLQPHSGDQTRALHSFTKCPTTEYLSNMVFCFVCFYFSISMFLKVRSRATKCLLTAFCCVCGSLFTQPSLQMLPLAIDGN